MLRLLSILALTGVTYACNSQQSEMANQPAPQTLEGQLRVAGADPAPMVMLRPTSGGAEVRLTGEYSSELMRLSGVTVSVTGSMGSAVQGMVVTGYEITSVQGRRPSVGVLVMRGSEVWLDGDPSIRIESPPEGLRSAIGAKVWILGTTDGGALRTESYGVIKPAGN